MISRRVCLAAVVALGLTACFGSGPEAAVQGFYGAVAEGNTDKAMGFLALESVSANEMIMVKGKIPDDGGRRQNPDRCQWRVCKG